MAAKSGPLPKPKRHRSHHHHDDDDEDDVKPVINDHHHSNNSCWKLYLSAEDADMVTGFLASHRNVRLRVSSDAEAIIAYTSLAELLRIVNRYTVLEIIDFWRSNTLKLLYELGRFSVDGSWLDSLEHSLTANSHVDSKAVQSLLHKERAVRDAFRCDVEDFNADIEKIREREKALLDARAALKVKMIL